MRTAYWPVPVVPSSGRSRCKNAAIAIASGSRVCDATSSGPAARVIPSPKFVTHDEANRQRKLRPRRDGAMSCGPAQTQPIAGAITGSQLVILAGCGHIPSIEAPQEYRQAVVNFLRR